jgi:hypothetical protein
MFVFAVAYQLVAGLTPGPVGGVFNERYAAAFGICGAICLLGVVHVVLVLLPDATMG